MSMKSIAVFLIFSSANALVGSANTATIELLISQANNQESDFHSRTEALKKLRDLEGIDLSESIRVREFLTTALEGDLSTHAAWALGEMGDLSVAPRIFELGEEKPNLINCYFQLLEVSERSSTLPIHLFRDALASTNYEKRAHTLNAIAVFNIVELSGEIDYHLEFDESERVRDRAAAAIWKMNLTGSLNLLRLQFKKGERSVNLLYALAIMGGDEDIEKLLPLLKSGNRYQISAITEGLVKGKLEDTKLARNAILEALIREGRDYEKVGIKALSHFQDDRLVPILKERIINAGSKIRYDDARLYFDSLSQIGSPDALDSLHEFLMLGYAGKYNIEQALVRIGNAESAKLVWSIYLKNPIIPHNGECLISSGYSRAIIVLAECADGDLLEQIKSYTEKSTYWDERRSLNKTIQKIEDRIYNLAQ